MKLQAVSYTHLLLAVRFRKKDSKGRWVGGAMEYMEDGVGKKWLASVFGVCCIFASLGMGNMTQANAIADAVQDACAVPPWITGLVLAVILALVVFGGLSRIDVYKRQDLIGGWVHFRLNRAVFFI